MGVLEITSFIVTAGVGGIALFKVFNDSRKNICAIVLNILFGGALFVILNILGYTINLNLITGGIITFLGIPGIILIILLKTMFGLF